MLEETNAKAKATAAVKIQAAQRGKQVRGMIAFDVQDRQAQANASIKKRIYQSTSVGTP